MSKYFFDVSFLEILNIWAYLSFAVSIGFMELVYFTVQNIDVVFIQLFYQRLYQNYTFRLLYIEIPVSYFLIMIRNRHFLNIDLWKMVVIPWLQFEIVFHIYHIVTKTYVHNIALVILHFLLAFMLSTIAWFQRKVLLKIKNT